MNEPVENLEMAETKEMVSDAYRTNCPRGTSVLSISATFLQSTIPSLLNFAGISCMCLPICSGS